MMYPFLTLSDGIEIVHSEMKEDGRVKVYAEKADSADGFHHLTCYLPGYEIEENFGFSEEETKKIIEVVESTAHLILRFAKTGGS